MNYSFEIYSENICELRLQEHFRTEIIIDWWDRNDKRIYFDNERIGKEFIYSSIILNKLNENI